MVEKAYTNDFESVEGLVDEFEGRIFKLNDDKQVDGPSFCGRPGALWHEQADRTFGARKRRHRRGQRL
jgi:hypothetical protein